VVIAPHSARVIVTSVVRILAAGSSTAYASVFAAKESTTGGGVDSNISNINIKNQRRIGYSRSRREPPAGAASSTVVGTWVGGALDFSGGAMSVSMHALRAAFQSLHARAWMRCVASSATDQTRKCHKSKRVVLETRGAETVCTVAALPALPVPAFNAVTWSAIATAATPMEGAEVMMTICMWMSAT